MHSQVLGKLAGSHDAGLRSLFHLLVGCQNPIPFADLSQRKLGTNTIASAQHDQGLGGQLVLINLSGFNRPCSARWLSQEFARALDRSVRGRSRASGFPSHLPVQALSVLKVIVEYACTVLLIRQR
jgi:hypothetical protein